MKNKLNTFFLFITALVVLSSCLIFPDVPSDPTTEKFVYSPPFSGPVYTGLEITSYQFMCYVTNNSGQTLENVKFEIDWKDPVGDLIMYDSVNIPRLEKGAKWPIGVIHKTASDITRLEGSTASIRYLSSSSDLNRYVIVAVNGHVNHDVTPTLAYGRVTNHNAFDILDPAVYVVTENSTGEKIAEYGMVQRDGLMPAYTGYYEFDVALNERAMSPSTTRHYFFAVARRSSI